MENVIVEKFTSGENKIGGYESLLEMCQIPMHPKEPLDMPYLKILKRRILGEFANLCCDNYYIAYTPDKCLSRLWTGWGKHTDSVGNFGHFLTLPESRGLGLGRQVLKLWYNDITTHADKPLALFCSAVPEIAEIYRPFGFREITPDTKGGPLYMPLGDSPETFAEFCEIYYKPSQALFHKKADFGYRHEIDCLLRFAFKLKDLSFYIDGAPSFETAFVNFPERLGMFFSEDGHCVGWSFDDKSIIHPLYGNSTVIKG